MVLNNNFTLSKFEIIGLFGEMDVSINFVDNIKILVGENGIGKTTILSIMYHSLSRNFGKLREYDFTEINIHDDKVGEVKIKKEWITLEENREVIKIQGRLDQILNEEEINFVNNYLLTGKSNFAEFRERFEETIRSRDIYPFQTVVRHINLLRALLENNSSYIEYSSNIRKADKALDQIVKNLNILYFPTYRRIEEDLNKLDVDIKKRLDNVKNVGEIQFGMQDVEVIFDNLKKQIRDEALEGYSKVTGNMIKKLIYMDEYISDEKLEVILQNKETIKVILARFGENLEKNDKEYIYKILKNDSHPGPKYNLLMHFLYNLINNYNAGREKDDAIKKFVNVCNKYLVNKKFVYDEHKVELFIRNRRGDNLELRQLSSGEKQIVSIFTKVYLSLGKEFIVLFDEPELSLSIEWQEKLLPDIMESDRCHFLLAVTHSPFIYDNELDEYADGIGLYIENSDYFGEWE